MKYIISILFGGVFLSASAKVLDLGELEVKGEVRRPNLNLVYSKKYFKKAIREMARSELKQFEQQLLKPGLRTKMLRKRKRIK